MHGAPRGLSYSVLPQPVFSGHAGRCNLRLRRYESLIDSLHTCMESLLTRSPAVMSKSEPVRANPKLEPSPLS